MAACPHETSETSETSGAMAEVVHRCGGLAVVYKPAGLACHWSVYARTRRPGAPPPLLQQARDLLGARVNLVHRLDQGASGLVLLALEEDAEVTAALSAALAAGQKTYVAWCRGSGEVLDAFASGLASQYRTPDGTEHPVKPLQGGWFEISRPIRDEVGRERDAVTQFRWMGGVSGECRSCLVLARPQTGRWHQIRRHLNGISHPIIGDSTHGNHKINREWRKRGFHRLGLHLHHLELPATFASSALSISCSLPSDLSLPLFQNAPDLGRIAQVGLPIAPIHFANLPVSDN